MDEQRPGMAQRRPSMRNAQLLEEASCWFVQFSEGDASPTTRQQFDGWLRASPEHVRAFLEISALWEDLPLLHQPGTVDVDELIAKVHEIQNVVHLDTASGASSRSIELGQRDGISATTATNNGRSPRHSFLSHMLVSSARVAAASLFVSALVALGLWFLSQRGLYSTSIGEQRSITLADGSTIELNALSRVRVTFDAAERDVDLIEGQALFEVAKDPSRPFVVRSGTARVRAVGTQFDVLKGSSQTVVTVIEGRVAVLATPAAAHLGVAMSKSAPAMSPQSTAVLAGSSLAAPAEAIVVSAGEQIALAQATTRESSSSVSRPQHADIAAATAWRQRKLVFASSPLPEVVEAYNRYHEKPLVLRDPKLVSFHVSGVFSATDKVALIVFLRAQSNIEVRETDRSFEISSRAAGTFAK